VSEDAVVTVRAQISGVFYRAGGPDQSPFVEPGTVVRKGETMALLESMKLFSKVKAPLGGTVVEVCAENEQTVSVGQPLFTVQRA
jgi:acetyl-CoA carboxylase biotin carboxyl carrier protein